MNIKRNKKIWNPVKNTRVHDTMCEFSTNSFMLHITSNFLHRALANNLTISTLSCESLESKLSYLLGDNKK